MAQVIVTEFISLDGVVEESTEWQKGYSSPEIGVFKREELFATDALLLGRVTYEGFAQYWPSATATGAFGERMNSLPKFVATTTLSALTWNNSTVIADVVSGVKNLKAQSNKTFLVYGSGTLVETLLQHGLVDELRLMVYPIVVGKGKRLFMGSNTLPMKHMASRDLGAGVVLLTYQPLSMA